MSIAWKSIKLGLVLICESLFFITDPQNAFPFILHNLHLAYFFHDFKEAQEALYKT